mmetsp:Transcript_48997/g.66779  ORF Transcript_48997/g.66779 Transcript_48997/m.66779 type:complete len:258 (-) Transcript_48997:227-1000(-)
MLSPEDDSSFASTPFTAGCSAIIAMTRDMRSLLAIKSESFWSCMPRCWFPSRTSEMMVHFLDDSCMFFIQFFSVAFISSLAALLILRLWMSRTRSSEAMERESAWRRACSSFFSLRISTALKLSSGRSSRWRRATWLPYLCSMVRCFSSRLRPFSCMSRSLSSWVVVDKMTSFELLGTSSSKNPIMSATSRRHPRNRTCSPTSSPPAEGDFGVLNSNGSILLASLMGLSGSFEGSIGIAIAEKVSLSSAMTMIWSSS